MRISDWSSDGCSSDLRARRDPRRGLARARPPAAAIIADAVFGVIGIVGVTGTIGLRDLAIILRALVDILDHQADRRAGRLALEDRSEEHTSELQYLMRISYAVFCLKKKKEAQQKVHQH